MKKITTFLNILLLPGWCGMHLQRLGLALWLGTIGSALALSTPALAQPFTLVTGAENPLNLVDVGAASKPAFVDINADGDKDCFSGETTGTILYYQNTGTAASPVFTSVTGAGNTFNGVDVGTRSNPDFVDVDADGDMDCFIGQSLGTLIYYQNTGTAGSPVFALVSGAGNPFNSVDIGGSSVPAFVDIDADGDKDCFIGALDGLLYYYQNTGTAASPVFTLTTGAGNPFNGVDVGTDSAPAFVDIGADRDMDGFIGNGLGHILYYQNTGTAGSPVFTPVTGAGNPFNGVAVGNLAFPDFVDVDADTDMDCFIGELDGIFNYYRNDVALPIELVHFQAQSQRQHVLLNWSTASERNNSHFEVERSAEGITFEKIGEVPGAGDSQTVHDYEFRDEKPLPGTNYYRLRQVDFNGNFEYSPIVSVVFRPRVLGVGNLKFFPNTARQGITFLYFPEAPETEGVLEIFDPLGNKVFHQKLQLEEFTPTPRGGSNLSVPVDLSSYPPGVYTARLVPSTQGGGEVRTERLVVAK